MPRVAPDPTTHTHPPSPQSSQLWACRARPHTGGKTKKPPLTLSRTIVEHRQPCVPVGFFCNGPQGGMYSLCSSLTHGGEKFDTLKVLGAPPCGWLCGWSEARDYVYPTTSSMMLACSRLRACALGVVRVRRFRWGSRQLMMRSAAASRTTSEARGRKRSAPSLCYSVTSPALPRDEEDSLHNKYCSTPTSVARPRVRNEGLRHGLRVFDEVRRGRAPPCQGLLDEWCVCPPYPPLTAAHPHLFPRAPRYCVQRKGTPRTGSRLGLRTEIGRPRSMAGVEHELHWDASCMYAQPYTLQSGVKGGDRTAKVRRAGETTPRRRSWKTHFGSWSGIPAAPRELAQNGTTLHIYRQLCSTFQNDGAIGPAVFREAPSGNRDPGIPTDLERQKRGAGLMGQMTRRAQDANSDSATARDEEMFQ
ncbi:hypothetical protein BKA62DRAFT_792353 [Auriculariales sp. MPI-PUGE-AT-0066]|nr:hypothetical protein BKA62DRAFT_792353 [Auriculariales sp. MPI-PUGE-AT-0066]